MLDMESLIGKKVELAINEIQDNGLRARIVRKDEEKFIITMEYRGNRVNLEVDNGLVSNYNIG